MNRILITGALLGFLAVVAGASADHVVRGSADAETLRSVMTAIRYHQLGALLVTMVGLALLVRPDLPAAPILARAGWLFAVGTVLFSFGIYAAALSGIDRLTWITPIGGLTLMAAWLALGWAAIAAGMAARG